MKKNYNAPKMLTVKVMDHEEILNQGSPGDTNAAKPSYYSGSSEDDFYNF